MVNNMHSICGSLKTAGTVALPHQLLAVQNILCCWKADMCLDCGYTLG